MSTLGTGKSASLGTFILGKVCLTCWFCLRREIKNTSNKQGWVWVGMGKSKKKKKNTGLFSNIEALFERWVVTPPPPPPTQRKSVPTLRLKYTSDVEVLLKRCILPPPPPPQKNLYLPSGSNSNDPHNVH